MDMEVARAKSKGWGLVGVGERGGVYCGWMMDHEDLDMLLLAVASRHGLMGIFLGSDWRI